MMSTIILDGIKASEQKRVDLSKKIKAFTDNTSRKPSLAVILIGNDPASEVYVKNKRLACAALGIHSLAYDLALDTSESALLELIYELNSNPEVDGILVQLPLPKHIDEYRIIDAIHPQKDVDGFHPYNIGCLAQKRPFLRPCTPKGIIELLNFYDYDLSKKHTVVVGASNIVGRPMALECLMKKSTVTICHRDTVDLKKYCEDADVLIVATGVPDLIQPEWIIKRPVMIDVGIHRLPDGQLRGDLDFEKMRDKASHITPVPGGVGPMTITALMENTLLCACLGMNSI